MVWISWLAEQLSASQEGWFLRSQLHESFEWAWFDAGADEPLNHPIPSKVAPSCRKWEQLKHFSLSDAEVGQLTALLPADECLISIHGATTQSTCDCALVSPLSVSYRVFNLWAASSAMSECVETVFCVMLLEPFHTGRQVSQVLLTGTGSSLQYIYTIVVEVARSGFSSEY
jgi:hypothetical protein